MPCLRSPGGTWSSIMMPLLPALSSHGLGRSCGKTATNPARSPFASATKIAPPLVSASSTSLGRYSAAKSRGRASRGDRSRSLAK